MQERELLKAIQKKKMDFISDRDATAAFRKEQKWLKLLVEGEIEQWNNPYGSENLYDDAVLTYKGDLKQLEYNLVATITLACRAMITSGVDPFEAYRISDIYLQQLSECTEMGEMMWVVSKAMGEYQQMARKRIGERKTVGSQDVENAKTYICRHIREPLTLRRNDFS